jgi:mRNA turnover protein 4
MGKNKVMRLALGKEAADEYKENLHLLSQQLSGNCGLLFTDQPRAEVLEFFSNYRERDYARAGFEATQEVSLLAGPLPQFSHAIEPYLRTKLGLPCSLRDGVVHLECDHVVCKPGDILTPEQAKLLVRPRPPARPPPPPWLLGAISDLPAEAPGYPHVRVHV